MPISPETLEKYRMAGRISARALDYGCGLLKEGTRLLDIAEKTEGFIREQGASPAFPVNIAIDDIAAHFSPLHDSPDTLQKGQVVKLDVGVQVDGYIGDTARTVEIGTSAQSGLIKASAEALRAAIEMARPGLPVRQIGGAVEKTIESFGFHPISNLSGHGLDQYSLHSGLSIPNIPESMGEKLAEGMVVAIEPFATDGTGMIKEHGQGSIYRVVRTAEATISEKPGKLAKLLGKDDVNELGKFFDLLRYQHKTLPFSERWAYALDRKAQAKLQMLLRYKVITSYPVLREVGGGLVSQCEHTILITPNGCEVLTKA